MNKKNQESFNKSPINWYGTAERQLTKNVEV